MTLLSLDIPVKHEGGYVRWSASKGITAGSIRFDAGGSERADYLTLWQLLTTLSADDPPNLVILEHPFLHSIAGPIGGAKMWCAVHDVPWFMITASQSKKVVLGNGRASKEEVRHWAMHWLKVSQLTQHVADAALYLSAWQRLHRQEEFHE